MRDQIEARLAELEAEIEIGERRWREADIEQTRLRETLIRMSGAAQILRELLEAQQVNTDSIPGVGASNGHVPAAEGASSQSGPESRS